MQDKRRLRERLRKTRRDHVASLPAVTRALLFRRPPSPIMAMLPDRCCVGLYHAAAEEAPSQGYARFFFEQGRAIALPRFSRRDAAMEFRAWANPWDDAEFEAGPFGVPQPKAEAPAVTPDVLFVPLLGFTAEGDRLGQGGGHYDRWLSAHPDSIAIGLGWDVQRCDSLPIEDHDRRLDAIVTPTRLYGPFAQERTS